MVFKTIHYSAEKLLLKKPDHFPYQGGTLNISYIFISNYHIVSS